VNKRITIIEPDSAASAELFEQIAAAKREFQSHLETGGFRTRQLEGKLGDLSFFDWYMLESDCAYFRDDEGASMSLLVSDILVANCGFTFRLVAHDSKADELVLVHRDMGCILFPWHWTWATYQCSYGESPLATAWIWRVIEQDVNSVADTSWHPVLDMAANQSHSWPADLQELARTLLRDPILLLRLGTIALDWKPTSELDEVRGRLKSALKGF
jgi:hypothetical protein